LWKIARRHRIELVHCNEQDTYPLGQYVARLQRVPAIVTIHSRLDEGFARWAFGGARCPSRVFFLTEASREVCRPAVRGILPQDVERVLPNGLDLTELCPDPSAGQAFRQAHNLGRGLLIGAGTWLRPGKQVEHLIALAGRLNRPDVRLVVAGGVVPSENDYAQRVIEDGRRELGSRWCYLGYTKDMRGFYNAIDLYINTSLAETCSISIIEALASGCPVLGYPSVSVGEQVLPDGGQIVPQNDIDALAAAAGRWLSDPARLAAARPLARRQAQRFEIGGLSRQLWQEYQQLRHERRCLFGWRRLIPWGVKTQALGA
jgi:glycosyltransferase involved in cell wall biosynthesis